MSFFSPHPFPKNLRRYSFHLVGCSPKIREPICTAVGVPFHAFADGVVFPKCPDIVPLRHGRKIVQYGIADSVIPEVILYAFLDFVAQVVRIRRKRENDKRLLQYFQIRFHKGSRYTDESGQVCMTLNPTRGQLFSASSRRRLSLSTKVSLWT